MRRKNRYNRTGWVAGFILILLLIGIGRDARADLPEILLKFQPYIWVDEAYTNNVDLTQTNKKKRFYHHHFSRDPVFDVGEDLR